MPRTGSERAATVDGTPKTEPDEIPVGSPTGRCDRCGCRDARPLFSSVDYLSGERFALLACERCGLRRTGFDRPEEALSEYYGTAYFGAKGLRFIGPLEWATALCRNQRARMVARYAGVPGRVLDLGCGRGLMLARLKRMGWQCVGTELSTDLASAARERHGLDVLPGGPAPLPFPDGSFDVVTTWHSLEHMARPVSVLREVRRVLKPGGLLMAEVPNSESLQAWFGGRRWFHLDVPRHLYHFSSSELKEILLEEGFLLQRESTRSWEQGPFGMTQSLLNRATFSPHFLFRLLRRERAALRGSARTVWDLVATLLLATPAALVGGALEAASWCFGRGGVTRVVARKGAQPFGPQVASRRDRS